MKFSSRGSLVATALCHVALAAVTMAIPVYLGIYKNVSVDLGYEHYAERANSTLGPFKFPSWIRMPANTLVNIGYLLVGSLWLYRVAFAVNPVTSRKHEDLYLMSVFASMSCIYGMVQYSRIVTQSYVWSVLDQWYTLPFFSWTIVWSQKIQSGWNAKTTICIVLASILSYNLTLLHKFGFEVALGVHMVIAVYNGCRVLSLHFNQRRFILFCSVIFNCCGFVFLKLADFHLARFAIFQELTGHFWSKICDFLQIHFTVMLFVHMSQDSKTV
ncbi:transmembrane protein 187-like [Apostichopus japonicus]|uniref:transmembrane protein 187-like n=1 Tax=Stichopus japonicus TaxID=307972 RepID=UPI003AB21911